MAEKIVKIKEAGHERLAVLIDFDKTLTKAYLNGKLFESIISVLREQNFLTDDYSEKAKALFAKYHPSCNKNGKLLKNLPILMGRDNFIALGDGIDDLGVVDGLKVNNSLTCLFFNKQENDLSEYQKSADVVICGDGTFDYFKNLEIF